MFVALFDYDPMSMSPNPDAADEELPFKEGQIIKVVESFLDVQRPYSFSHEVLNARDDINILATFFFNFYLLIQKKKTFLV